MRKQAQSPATSLHNKVYVVTGASSGIGRAIALALAAEGAKVVLAARREELLRQVADEIESGGNDALAVPTDVTQAADVAHLIEATLQRFGRIDGIVANAGVYFRSLIETLTPEVFERSLEINFMGAVRPVMAALPHLRAQKSGHIVLICSMDGKKGLRTDGPYVAAKYAMAGFGDVLRQELRGSGVDVSILFPGRVATPMIEGLEVPLISRPISAEAVARSTIAAIRHRRAEVIVPFRARFLWYAHVVSPRLSDWAIAALRLEGWKKGHSTRYP